MSNGWYYTSGDWWVNCDVCSKSIKASESKHRWDGLIVCPEDWEERHIQDFLRVTGDKITVPFIRKETEDYLDTCDIPDRHSYAGIGVAGCMIAGMTLYSVSELFDGYICTPEGHLPDADLAQADCAEI